MATNKVVCSYQEIIDLHTESDTVSVVGIHTPTGDVPKQMFSGFYKQFKKFKYLGANIAMVPAARLPADPLQVSYEAGEPTIDPRDMLNPIMFRGCHGDDMGAILNQMYQSGTLGDLVSGNNSLVGDIDIKKMSGAEMVSWDQNFEGTPRNDNPLGVIESLYYKALVDNTWLKAHPQKGFRKSGLHPRVYQVLADRQYLSITGGPVSGTTGENSGINPNVTEYYNGNPESRRSGTLGPSIEGINISNDGTAPPQQPLVTGNSPAGFNVTTPTAGLGSVRPRYLNGAGSFFTGRTVPLGWLDTYQQVSYESGTISYSYPQLSNPANGVGSLKNAIAAGLASTWTPANLPRVYMGMIMLPPAYKTEQYFRLVINHKFAFAGFRGISMQNSTIDETLDVPSYFNANGEDVEVYHPDQINNRPWGNDPL